MPGIGRPLGMRHHAQHPAVFRQNPGNIRDRAVDRRRIAEGDAILILQRGQTFGVDLVDDSDPVWRRLVTEAIGDETGEDDED